MKYANNNITAKFESAHAWLSGNIYFVEITTNNQTTKNRFVRSKDAKEFIVESLGIEKLHLTPASNLKPFIVKHTNGN